MRNLYLLSLILFCVCYTLKADIIRVNNNNGISADYSNLQTAIDSANAGDTIYLEPSSNSYGTITLDKRISLYGPGYFLAENSGQQANVNTSKITTLTMNQGSAFTSITGIVFTNNLNLNVGNVAITRCLFTSIATCITFDGTASNTNVLIAQNYIVGNLSNGGASQSYTVYFRNNFIGGVTMALEPGIVCDFTNNVLNWYSSAVYNTSFVNNIFISNNNLIYTSPTYNNGFENNIFRSSGTSVDTSLGNVTGVNTTQLFIESLGQGTTDGRWQIVPGSLADDFGKEIPAGTPTDAGMFGGPNPYKLAGVPAIPTIYDLVVPTSNTSGGLNVTIRAKSQD